MDRLFMDWIANIFVFIMIILVLLSGFSIRINDKYFEHIGIVEQILNYINNKDCRR